MTDAPGPMSNEEAALEAAWWAEAGSCLALYAAHGTITPGLLVELESLLPYAEAHAAETGDYGDCISLARLAEHVEAPHS